MPAAWQAAAICPIIAGRKGGRPGSGGGRIAATQRRLGGPDATARVRRHPGTMTGAWR